MTAAAPARKHTGKTQQKTQPKASGKVADQTVGDAEAPSGPRYTRKSYPKPKEGFKLFEAGPGGAGYINVRQFDKVMRFAADISDPDRLAEGKRDEAWVLGRISRFFPDEDKANRYKEQKEEDGYKVRIIEARPYEGEIDDE